jgi:dextranase
VELLDLDRVVDRVTATFRLRAGRSERSVNLVVPAISRHGYGIRATLRSIRDHAPLATTETAVEALDGWWESPRHAAITDFRTPVRAAAAIRSLRDWHVTVVQLYDWMYRHYRYEPPSGSTFTDTLGQRVSHDAVRAAVRAGHRVGVASLAYGSVYGAEREYVDAHPGERVFDADGEPLSLGGTFFINDLRSGSPWRARLLGQYASAVRRFGFDGIHMDTYGPPHDAVADDGSPIDFAAIYPGLIADGAATVAAVEPEARVLFNCVEGFPLESVASAPAAAIYLELWPPDVAYRDVVRWIDSARAAGEGRAVVIAAYLSTLRTVEEDRVQRAGALEAGLLPTSIIAVAGAYHHALAAPDRLLVEGYYPEARPLRSGERRNLIAAWVFTARYLHLLSDPGLVADAASTVELRGRDGRSIPTCPEPRAGTVWLRVARARDGTCVVHLVDLLDQSDDRWDGVRQPSPTRTGWRWVASAADDRTFGAVLAMSPWSMRGAAQAVHDDRLPPFRRWLMLVLRPR